MSLFHDYDIAPCCSGPLNYGTHNIYYIKIKRLFVIDRKLEIDLGVEHHQEGVNMKDFWIHDIIHFLEHLLKKNNVLY